MFLELFLRAHLTVLRLLLGSLRIHKHCFLCRVWLVCLICCFHIIDVSSTSCGGRLTDPTGSIKSPTYPGVSSDSITCRWDIVAPQYDKILLTFTVFDVKAGSSRSSCDHDYVEVLEGTRSLGKYCNSVFPKGTISSKSNTLTVIYNHPLPIKRSLFHAKYEREPCGDFKTGLKGEISSPNYPGPYPAPKHCSWRIQVPNDMVIRFYFLTFNLDPTSKCNLDFIKAIDGFNATSRLIGHFCASRIPPKEIRSTGNTMRLEFQSFKPTLTAHFHGYYEAETHCGGVLNGDTGSFTSPGYGTTVHIATIQVCQWTIEVPDGRIISVVFASFDVKSSPRCSNDFVEVFDGPMTGVKSTSMGRYCGREVTNPPTVRSTGNTMVIKLHRSTDSGKGFFATYTAVDPKNPYDKCSEASDELLYKCDNGNYVQCQWKCDGTDDCGDKSDEKNCFNGVNKTSKNNKLTSYVIILVSITGSAVVIALVIFVIDRLRKKRRSQATRRRRRRRARLRAFDPDSTEPSSPPPTYDFAVSVSSCCDTTSSPPTYAESVTPAATNEAMENPAVSNQTDTCIPDIEQSSNTVERTSHNSDSQSGQVTELHEIELCDNVECVSLGESPPTSDTSPLIA